MTVWGIADLHLCSGRAEGRAPTGGRWRDHAATIERHWRAVVGPGDLVLIPGDVSMARTHREVQPDLSWLERLPGRKVLSAGNHDRWFNRADAVRRFLRRSQQVVCGDAIEIDGVIVVGGRGAPVVLDEPTAAQKVETERALAEIDRALAGALALRTAGQPLFALWHYPPFDAFKRPGPWVERFERAGVTACLYGHLHAQSQWALAVQGLVRGTHYHCVAADAVGFRPLRIAILPDSNPTVLEREGGGVTGRPARRPDGPRGRVAGGPESSR